MSFRVQTCAKITPSIPQDQLDPADIDVIGEHPIDFVVEDLEPVRVHSEGIKQVKSQVHMLNPDFFDIEIVYPAGANTQKL